MQFTYENQGTNTYLVYKISDDEVIDTMCLGMLSNNKIPGLATAIFTQMNMEKYVKYNISAKVTVKQFFSSPVNKKRLIGVCLGIVDAIISAEEYMIEQNSVLLDIDYIFADVSTCETVLISLPVESKIKMPDVGSFFKNIIFSIQYDQTENIDYVGKIVNYLNSSPVFSVYDFKKVLEEINGKSVKQRKGYTNTELKNEQQNNAINSDMEQVNNNNREITKDSLNNIGATTNHEADKYVVDSKRDYESKRVEDNKVLTEKRDMSSVRFEMPEKSVEAKNQVGTGPNKTSKNIGEKTMSKMYLLSHYSKENAEIYKQQKSKKKHQQTSSGQPVSGVTMGDSIVQPEFNNAEQKLVQPIYSNSVKENRSYQNQYVDQNHMQQNNMQTDNMDFGDTMVLATSQYSADTEVLAVNPMQKKETAYLVRVRNGERVQVDKDIFRIGKEKSYVDYFIGDNPAISRSHANILKKNEVYYIVDTNSSNHTYVNGVIINSNSECKLDSGAKIKLANEDFEFIIC